MDEAKYQKMIQIIAYIVCGLAISMPASTQEDGFSIVEKDVEQSEIPEAELLEFLAEFAGIDDETFELVVYHGVEDAEESADEKEEGADND